LTKRNKYITFVAYLFKLKNQRMKTNNYLFPTLFKKIGWIISIPSAIVVLLYMFKDYWYTDTTPAAFTFFRGNPAWAVLDMLTDGGLIAAIFMVLLLVGLLFIAFSKDKMEDEYISKLRGDSLIWAVFANSILLFISFLVVYDVAFLYVAFFNLYSLLVLFVIKFSISLHQLKKSGNHEE